MQEMWVQSLGPEDPWRRKWQPIAVFLPGKSHGQRSLAGYSPWGGKESDRTEHAKQTRDKPLSCSFNLLVQDPSPLHPAVHFSPPPRGCEDQMRKEWESCFEKNHISNPIRLIDFKTDNNDKNYCLSKRRKKRPFICIKAIGYRFCDDPDSARPQFPHP